MGGFFDLQIHSYNKFANLFTQHISVEYVAIVFRQMWKRTGHRYNKRSSWHSLPSKPAIPLDVGFYCMTAINIAVDTTQLNQSKKTVAY